MNNVVHLLWFVKEKSEGLEDIELLIGVYSSEVEAKAAIERVRDQPGFVEFQLGFEIHPYILDTDCWREGFIAD